MIFRISLGKSERFVVAKRHEIDHHLAIGTKEGNQEDL